MFILKKSEKQTNSPMKKKKSPKDRKTILDIDYITHLNFKATWNINKYVTMSINISHTTHIFKLYTINNI
jgi:hypothetical protein